MKDKSQRTLTPKLRFPEFRDAAGWEERNGGELFANRAEPGEAGIPIYSVTMNNGMVKRSSLERVVDDIAEPEGNKRARKDDIAYNMMRMWQGALGVASEDCMVSPAYVVLSPMDGVCSDFFAYLFKLPQSLHLLTSHSRGLTKDRLRLYYADFTHVPLVVPAFAEQRRIAVCLTSLDGLIAAHHRKLEAQRAHKKGLLQQLFPREGETRPRLRFPEFHDAPEWEEKKLSTSIRLVSGVHLAPDEYSTEGEIPYFTGPSDFTNAVEDISKWTADSTNSAKEHDTLITVKGSGVGEIWYLTLPKVAIGRQLMAVRAEGGSSRFIHHFLSTRSARFKALASGNLIPGLSRSDFLDMSAPFPSRPEQQRIADCLSSLDDLIAATAETLAALKTHKKGLMQQLFPSPERF